MRTCESPDYFQQIEPLFFHGFYRKNKGAAMRTNAVKYYRIHL